MGKIKNSVNKLKHMIPRYKNLSTGWKAGIISLTIVTLIFWVRQCYVYFASRSLLSFIIGTSLTCAAVIFIAGIVLLVLGLFRKIPLFVLGCILSSFVLITLSIINTYSIVSSLLVSVMIIILSILIGININKLMQSRCKKISAWIMIIILSCTTFGSIYWSITTVCSRTSVVNAKKLNEFKDAYPESDNPANGGNYKVKFLTYGSGNNLRRKEFGKNASIITDTVDGTNFLGNWNFLRKEYLGFGKDRLPINGSVWYPEGNGPFPLVIMVHGNHNMPQFSDRGYDYLGKFLASRGYVFASIDENFLNSSAYDDVLGFYGIQNETPARALIILEHIKAFDKFNKSSSNPFYNKIDMNNISLIGHSRGGEAVAAAAALNKLKTYPDNGAVKLNYNYNIRSVVAIAPVDGSFKPAAKSIELKDINYLVIQGSDDMDVNTFMGYNQYKRVSFTPDKDNYKASVYIYGANHGQFNNSWGRQDIMGAGGYNFFNIKNLISENNQNMIAKVFISAFLDSTIKGKSEYRNIFKDTRNADNWLPKTIFLNDYNDSKTTDICSYDEDMDLNTTTLPGGSIKGENFNLWTEKELNKKRGSIDNKSVYLSWNNKNDTNVPAYYINLPSGKINITNDSTLVFSMADGSMNNNKPIDLSIKLYDKNGNTAELPLSNFELLQNTLKTKILKFPFNKLGSDGEPVFQKFIFNLNDFKKVNSKFNPSELKRIGFIFDKTNKGTVFIDDIGID